MVIKKGDDIRSSEITDPKHYFNRRLFLKGTILAATTVATGSLYRMINPPPARSFQGAKLKSVIKPGPDARAQGYIVDDKLTPFVDITNYNNFYEFSTEKRGVAPAAKNFVTRPWTVTVDGLVNKPRTFDLDDLLMLAPAEERIYRHRCVEGWSMVIPWVGFSLSKLLKAVDPNSKARYVAFQTLLDPKRMPNQNTGVLDWPYVEGLRLDEAMHPLTILASGLYGQAMPPQDGAPLKLVVPWKYGFKGIKSIVRISLVETEPPTTWNRYASNEYGFYSNVNPHVDHPRWSQAKERRIGEFDQRDTLMFNGYGEQVAHLYQGMDLRKYY
jgi:methionine sulfoxide reductase catalytic subunit